MLNTSFMLVMNQLSRSDLEKDFIKKWNAKVFLKTVKKTLKTSRRLSFSMISTTYMYTCTDTFLSCNSSVVSYKNNT